MESPKNWEPSRDLAELVDRVLAQEREPRLIALRHEHDQLKSRAAANGTLRSGATVKARVESGRACITEFTRTAVAAVMRTLDDVYGGALPVEALAWIRERIHREIDGLANGLLDSVVRETQRLKLPLEERHIVRMYAGADHEPKRLLEIELGRRRVGHDLQRLTPPRRSSGKAAADAFISHASEDKADVAVPLAKHLEAAGFTVWLDQTQMKLGDRLLDKIDEGLAACRYGVTILSPHFFEKRWPRAELAGLAARQDAEDRKIILPVWHKIDHAEIARYSPTLAAVLGISTRDGLEKVAEAIIDVLRDGA